MRKMMKDIRGTYQINFSEMYWHFMRVCRGNLRRGAKICKTCPFVGFLKSAAQSYADENGLSDPLEGIP